MEGDVISHWKGQGESLPATRVRRRRRAKVATTGVSDARGAGLVDNAWTAAVARRDRLVGFVFKGLRVGLGWARAAARTVSLSSGKRSLEETVLD